MSLLLLLFPPPSVPGSPVRKRHSTSICVELITYQRIVGEISTILSVINCLLENRTEGLLCRLDIIREYFAPVFHEMAIPVIEPSTTPSSYAKVSTLRPLRGYKMLTSAYVDLSHRGGTTPPTNVAEAWP